MKDFRAVIRKVVSYQLISSFCIVSLSVRRGMSMSIRIFHSCRIHIFHHFALKFAIPLYILSYTILIAYLLPLFESLRSVFATLLPKLPFQVPSKMGFRKNKVEVAGITDPKLNGLHKEYGENGLPEKTDETTSSSSKEWVFLRFLIFTFL